MQVTQANTAETTISTIRQENRPRDFCIIYSLSPMQTKGMAADTLTHAQMITYENAKYEGWLTSCFSS